MKNILIVLMFFTTLFLAGYVAADSLQDIYNCNKKNGVVVKQLLGGYVCLDGKELK